MLPLVLTFMMLAGVGLASDESAATVTDAGRARPARQAYFGIAISAERWDADNKTWRHGREHAQVSY
jgi:hypothetical protein